CCGPRITLSAIDNHGSCIFENCRFFTKRSFVGISLLCPKLHLCNMATGPRWNGKPCIGGQAARKRSAGGATLFSERLVFSSYHLCGPKPVRGSILLKA